MKVKLKVTNKSGTVEHSMKSGANVIVGRSSKCDFQLDDERMSSSHCQLTLSYNRLELIDLDSKNGTYLNGIRIESSEVFLGDKIRVGKSIIHIEGADPEADKVLDFAGATKDRLNYELKADFTGARVTNQNAEVQLRAYVESDHVKEIDIRRRVKSKLTLSKHEIKLRNKVRSKVAFLIDLLGLFGVLIIPLVILAKNQRNEFLLYAEILAVILYFLINFRIMKFTLGETLGGIKKLYRDQ